ncbi:hypothetical protein MANES_10G081475v8 [Manihot esculenta]|uniref:Uncharacterized protein n=1 Tax=Manihot esculenta TaxID=3983 RepID=A0ACB7GZI7_MANES|nr:hypothetical protein MANES_10G081475v8 [Manihot esculenta]
MESVLWMQIIMHMGLMVQVNLQWKQPLPVIMDIKEIFNGNTQIHIHISLLHRILIYLCQSNHPPTPKPSPILVINLVWVHSSALIHHNTINIIKIKALNHKMKVVDLLKNLLDAHFGGN